MILRSKIDGALRTIDTALTEFKRPAVMCSFGKDSLVALHLALTVNPNLPVIFHREPFQPHKYAFANRLIQEWNLTVYDYQPSAVSVQDSGEEFEIISHYAIGRNSCALPTGIRPPVDVEHMLCGLESIYRKPLGTFNYPWDLVFHGHKTTDFDPILGNVALGADFARNVHSVSACFPIRHFTDAEVWEYTESNGLPIHHDRYEKVNGTWSERFDKRANPDYINACVECMRRDGPSSVPCPKLNGHTVSNVWSQLNHLALPPLTYLKENP